MAAKKQSWIQVSEDGNVRRWVYPREGPRRRRSLKTKRRGKRSAARRRRDARKRSEARRTVERRLAAWALGDNDVAWPGDTQCTTAALYTMSVSMSIDADGKMNVHQSDMELIGLVPFRMPEP